MPNATCVTCTHPQRHLIEIGLTHGTPFRIGQLLSQRARLAMTSQQASEFGNIGDVVRVEQAITLNLKLVAGLLNQLTTHHTVEHRNVLISADYLRLRQAIIAALRPFPEASKAVGEALRRLESEAAKDIQADAAAGKPLRLIEHDPSGVMQ